MIVSASSFLNELDILEIRLNQLRDTVDLFVLIEAPVTFAGTSKPLYFNENRTRFSGFNIHHIILDDMPNTPSSWDRERHQHQAMTRCLVELDPEIVLYNDTDEIPTHDVVERFRALNVDAATIQMQQLLFYFNRRDTRAMWNFPRICRFKGHEPGRADPRYPLITEAGWHFEYMGNRSTLLEKINSTSHAVESGGQQMWQSVYAGKKPGLEYTEPYPEDRLPSFVQYNRERFAPYFA